MYYIYGQVYVTNYGPVVCYDQGVYYALVKLRVSAERIAIVNEYSQSKWEKQTFTKLPEQPLQVPELPENK